MSYSFDLIKQLVADLQKDGFTPEEITSFRSNGNLRAFRDVIRGTHKIQPIEGGLASSFFQTRERLWVSNDFSRLVLTKAIAEAKPAKTKHFDLPRYMTDNEIEQELGDGHIWDEAVLCATLQKLLEAQWGGKEGKLLNNGYANLFYTSSCVVRVHWRSDGRKWLVSAWGRVVGWYAGRRAFSRN